MQSLTKQQLTEAALEHIDEAYRMAALLTDGAGDAGELVMATYVAVAREADRFRRQHLAPRLWVFKLLYEIASGKREPRASSEGPGVPLGFAAADARIEDAIRRMPRAHRVVLLLWSVERLSCREAAEVLDLPLEHVEAMLQRARTLLAGALRTDAPTKVA